MQNQNSQIANNDPFLRDLQLFCLVAHHCSFIAGANAMGISPAHVSKRIAMLEERLGVKLLHRTTRRVSITGDGEVAFQWAKKILDDVENMAEAVAGTTAGPKGILRISTSLRLGREYIAPILSLLRKKFPRLEVWLELQDRRADFLGDNLDIDIRVGEVHEQHLIAHKIVETQRILCAAPSYLAQHGEPNSLNELAQHQCLPFRGRDQAFGVWRLHGPTGQESVKVTGPMASNHSDIVRQWAHDGYGIIMSSDWDVAKSLESGRLVQVLPTYYQPADIWAVTAARASESEKIRVCIDFLKHELINGDFSLSTYLAKHAI